MDSHSGLSVEAALRMVNQGVAEELRGRLTTRSIADSATLVEVLQAAVTEPIVAELREPNAALLFAALQEAVTRPLVAELRELQADRNDIQTLRDEVASLRSELAQARVLPLATTLERIDQALEAEMREGIEASAESSEALGRQEGVEIVNGVEPQRREHESWIAEVALEALTAASELPVTVEERQWGGEAQDSSDGPIVRAARWLEQRLRGRDSSN